MLPGGAECLFDLLGILFAKEGKKATEFDKIFGSLGVVFNLTNVSRGCFDLYHTETRKSELTTLLQDMLQDGSFTSKAVERLRGRLLWFENFVCGRHANVLVAKLGKFVTNTKHVQNMPPELKEDTGKAA